MGELAAVREELERARDETNRVTLENERLIDERDALEQRIQRAADAKLGEMEDKFDSTIAQTRAEAQHRVEVIRIELEQLRRAASGDSCGWKECEDGTFSNVETGENGVREIPETLAFARAVRRVDDLGTQEETAKVAQKRAQTAETRRRELDVKLNEARADARSHRELLGSWTLAAKLIASSISTQDAVLTAHCDSLQSHGQKLLKQSGSLKQSTLRVQSATRSIRNVRKALSVSETNKKYLEAEIVKLGALLGKTQQELASLRSSLTSAVEAEVKPMRTEMSKARDALSRERLARMVERRQLAALWPSGYLAPVSLRRHIHLGVDERSELLGTARTAAADAEIKREIRRRVADASRWVEATDDYGRKYFVHSDTAEASWQAPPAMLYEPPPGRDELGNIVAVNVTPITKITDNMAPAASSGDTELLPQSPRMPLNTWEEIVDEWGQTSWKNISTGELSWVKPSEADLPMISAQPSDQIDPVHSKGAHASHPEVTTERQSMAQKKQSFMPDEDATSSGDDEAPSACDGAFYFSERHELHLARSKRRKRTAILSARKAIAFLEEAAFINNLRGSDQVENDTPTFVDVQALRALAAGDDNWKYVSLKERTAAKVRAEALRIATEREAKATEEARRAELRRTLAQRRKVSGLATHHPPSASLTDPPQSYTNVTNEGIDTYNTGLISHENLQEPPTIVIDSYQILCVNARKFNSVHIAPDGFSLEQIRKDLEAAARAEELLLEQLTKMRLRVAAISYKLLCYLGRSRQKSRQEDCVSGTDLSIKKKEPSDLQKTACQQLNSLRGALLARVPADREAGLKSAPDTDYTQTNPPSSAVLINVLAAEVILSGFTGQPIQRNSMEFAKKIYNSLMSCELRWSSLALIVNAPAHALSNVASPIRGTGPSCAQRLAKNQEQYSKGHTESNVLNSIQNMLSARETAHHTTEIARLLDLGESNLLPEQFSSLADMPETTCQTLKFDSCKPICGFFEPSASPGDSATVCRTAPSAFVRDATNAIAEIVSAHDKILSALILRSARLGAELWIDHEALAARTGRADSKLGEIITRQESILDAANRRAQTAQTRHIALLRSSKQKDESESKALATLKELVADAAHELIGRDRAMEARQQARSEARAEFERGIWLARGAQHAVSTRAAQVVERSRQARALVRLQHSLHAACMEHCRATVAYELLREKSMADAMTVSQLKIVALREELCQEGRRRRFLHETELRFFRADVRRLLRDQEAKDERSALLTAVANARLECDNAILDRRAAMVAATASKNSMCNSCVTGNRMAETRVAAAYAQLALLENSRRCARIREQKQRNEDLLVPRSERLSLSSNSKEEDVNLEEKGGLSVKLRRRPLPPDTPFRDPLWLPARAQKLLRSSFASGHIKCATETSLNEHRRACNAISELHDQLLGERASRRRVHAAALCAGVRAAQTAKHLAKEARTRASKDRVWARRDALREARERDVAESNFRDRLKQCKQQIFLHIALAEALRHSLGVEAARRRVRDLAILEMTQSLAKLRACSRDEVYYERAHSARLELWVHTLLASFSRAKTALMHRETLLDQQKKLDMRAQRALRLDVWRHTTAAHALGLDTSALFLFFAQRVATMSGAHHTFNNALRANGAALVLAAMCRSPRRELRRLSAKALAALTWNCQVDSRALGADVREQWRLWVDVAVSREMERLRRNLGFDDRSVQPRRLSQAQSLPSKINHGTPRDAAVARRQWALRRRRLCEGPNHANMRQLVTGSTGWLFPKLDRSNKEAVYRMPAPLIKVLLVLSRDRDQECVLAATRGLAGVSFNATNASSLGRVDGLISAVVGLVQHANPEVVALACDAAANLAFQMQQNQEALGAAGLVEIFVDKLRSSISRSSRHTETTYDTDIVESVVSALANVLSLHAPNADRLVAAGGLDVLSRLLQSHISVDLLNSDREAQIQAGAANSLANAFASLTGGNRCALITTFSISETNEDLSQTPSLTPLCEKSSVSSVILLCVANISTARRSAALLLGNLALDPELRSELGQAGAIEALWSISNKGQNKAQCATALWALSNLAWSNSPNQERCGQFIENVIDLAAVKNTIDRAHFRGDYVDESHMGELLLGRAAHNNVLERACALHLVANALYFNDSNRIRVESSRSGVETIVTLAHYCQPPAVREAALRCLASLTATDRGAKRVLLVQTGTRSDVCRTLVDAAGDTQSGGESANVRRLGAAALANICSLADARRYMFAAGGTDALVGLCGAVDEDVRHEAVASLAALEDDTSGKYSKATENKFGHKALGLLQTAQCASKSRTHVD